MRYASLNSRWRSAASVTRPLRYPGQVRYRSNETWDEYGSIAPELLERRDGALYRKRGHGKRSLPVPPMLDAEYRAARMQRRQSKPMATEEARTPFEEELSRNLFAWTLATPIRQCTMTRARLPNHFLIPFELRLDRLADPDDASGGHARARITLAGGDDNATGKRLSKYTWLALSHDSVSRFASNRSKAWQVLVGTHMRNRMNESTAGYKTEKKIGTIDDLPTELLHSLDENVRSAMKAVLAREDLLVTAGDNHDRLLDVGMLITLGGNHLHVETLVNGITHFVWNEHISNETEAAHDEQHEAKPHTYGILTSEEATELFKALDRRFAYSKLYKQKDDAIRTASMEALLEFFRSLKQSEHD